MKKSIRFILAAVIAATIISCNSNQPTNPADGGTYLVEEVCSLIGQMSIDAQAQLEDKGYELTDEDSHSSSTYNYIDTKNSLSYQIELSYDDDLWWLETDGEIVYEVFGETTPNYNDFKLWRTWLEKQMNYKLWVGYINNKIFIDDNSLQIFMHDIYDIVYGEYGGIVSEEMINIIVDSIIKEYITGNKTDFEAQLSKTYNSKDDIIEVYGEYDDNYNGKFVIIAIEKDIMYCDAQLSNLRDIALPFDMTISDKVKEKIKAIE